MDGKTSHDAGTEIITIDDLSEDEIDSITSADHDHLNARSMNDRSDDLGCQDIQSTNDKVNDTSDGSVNKLANISEISNSTASVYYVLDEKTGELVASDMPEENNSDDERNTEGVSNDVDEFMNDNWRCDDVQSSDTKLNETPVDTCNTTNHGRDKQDNEMIITNKLTRCSADSKEHKILHIPFEKQKELLSSQVTTDFVLLQPRFQSVSNQAVSAKDKKKITGSVHAALQPIVHPVINLCDKLSDAEPFLYTGTKKLTVWAESLVDIGFDLVHSSILQDFMNLANNINDIGMYTRKRPDVAIENAKRKYERLRHITEHLDVSMNRKCKLCKFRTESSNVMYWHQQHPHTNPRGFVSCSYCTFKARDSRLFDNHMKTKHMEQAFFEKEAKKYGCSLCNYKTGSLVRSCKHQVFCERTFKLDTNLFPRTSHVTYCLHDGMFVKQPVQNIPPNKLTQPQNLANHRAVYNAANVSNPPKVNAPMLTKVVYPPNIHNSMAPFQRQLIRPMVQPVTALLNTGGTRQLPSRQMFRPSVQAVASFPNTGEQEQLPSRQTSVQPVTLFLNTGVQHQVPLRQTTCIMPTTQPVTSFLNTKNHWPQVSTMQTITCKPMVHPAASIHNKAEPPYIVTQSIVGQQEKLGSLFSGPASRKPGVLPTMPSQLTPDTSKIFKLFSDPQYDEQHKKQLEQLQQLQAQNFQAMKLLKQQDVLLQRLQKANSQLQTPATITTAQNDDTVPTSVNFDNNSTPNFIGCEICKGFVKDLVALRLHLFYAHQVSISDKAFNANSPPFWCCFCQCRLWSRRGLRIHRLNCRPKIQTPVAGPAAPLIIDIRRNTTGKVTSHKCFICDGPVSNFLDHMQSVHDLIWADFVLTVNKRKCVACGLIFFSCDLTSHMACTHGLSLVYPHKSETFSKKKNTSLNTLGNSGRYTHCEICNYLVMTKSYQDHIQTKHLKMYRVVLKRLSEQQIEQYAGVKYRKLDSGFHGNGEEFGSTSPQQLFGFNLAKPMKGVPVASNENIDTSQIEAKQVVKCHVAVNCLSEQQIETYTTGKDCKLNSALQVSTEEVASTSVQHVPQLNAEAKPLRRMRSNTNQNIDKSETETKQLTKCSVTVNCLSKLQTEQYASRTRKLNSTSLVPAEEVAIMTRNRDNIDRRNTISSADKLDRRPIVHNIR